MDILERNREIQNEKLIQKLPLILLLQGKLSSATLHMFVCILNVIIILIMT